MPMKQPDVMFELIAFNHKVNRQFSGFRFFSRFSPWTLTVHRPAASSQPAMVPDRLLISGAVASPITTTAVPIASLRFAGLRAISLVDLPYGVAFLAGHKVQDQDLASVQLSVALFADDCGLDHNSSSPCGLALARLLVAGCRQLLHKLLYHAHNALQLCQAVIRSVDLFV